MFWDDVCIHSGPYVFVLEVFVDEFLLHSGLCGRVDIFNSCFDVDW